MGLIALLYAIALAVLVAEIFIPSHGILTVAGLGFLIAAVVKTFQMSNQAGVVAILACAVLLPTAAALAVKVWPHTWIGRKISPDNPVLSARDVGVDVDEMQAMIGRVGRSLTPLRPSGTCDFNGRRFPCVAEMGMIDRDVEVQVVGIKGSNLTVVAKTPSATV
ncbi:MAG: NfeD family protein [Planctomycetota bacterium]